MAHPDENPGEQRSWFGRLHLSWPMLLLAGWLLYEFTAQPGLAALVACAKFGWAEFRTAFWLRRVDPDRPRGKTCFWSYLTYGLWKIAVLATITMIIFGFLSVLFDPGPRKPLANGGLSPVLGGAMAAAAVGFGLSFPTTYIALWSAWRNGVRIWLGQAANRARKERFWPPCHGRVNVAPFVGFTLLVQTMWFIVFLALGFAVIIQPMGVAIIFFWIGTMLTMLVALLILGHVFSRVMARSPQECWVAEDGEAVYQVHGNTEGMSEA